MERLDPESVATDPRLPRLAIDDDEGEQAGESRDRRRAPQRPAGEQHFAVGFGPERPAGGDAFAAQLDIIIDFAVIDHDIAVVGDRHGLVGARIGIDDRQAAMAEPRSEEHTSELQSLMRISYAVFCLKKKTK